MRIALIADSFPPLCNSGAVQLRDLSREFIRQGHKITVLLPSDSIENSWKLEDLDGIQVLRLKALKIKDINYIQRTIAEFLMPFLMFRNLRKSQLTLEKWDAIIWYSPSIFFGPLISKLKRESGCKGYLIIRDIFPEWAVDIGLMSRGLPYLFFKAIASYQYSVADIIGVQTNGNCAYFSSWIKKPNRKLEILQNWLDKPADVHCSIRVNETVLAGRKLLVYAGNMGVAQGMDITIDLAEKLQSREDVGFLFVGRGSEAHRLRAYAEKRMLNNVLFYDEINPDEIPNLYAQCSVGIVSLNPRHKSHNIPGKFLTYMQCGLPVLAIVNAGNDLIDLIRNEQVGQVCDSYRVNDLVNIVTNLLKQIESDILLSERCKTLFMREFSVTKTTQQIVSAVSTKTKSIKII